MTASCINSCAALFLTLTTGLPPPGGLPQGTYPPPGPGPMPGNTPHTDTFFIVLCNPRKYSHLL